MLESSGSKIISKLPERLGYDIIQSLEDKKKYLDIAALQQKASVLVPNKLSDKLGRRDIQFYDMYVKKEDAQELGLLNDKGFPLEIDAEQYYNELEVEDFNHIFFNPNLIQERFGKSIKVTLTIDKSSKQLSRKVIENPDLIDI